MTKRECIEIQHVSEIGRVAETLLAFCQDIRCITFVGDIGAGKTTLINALCQLLEVKDLVSSPTFSLVNIYEGGKKTVYHMDLYRLEDFDEALNIGIEEYLDSPNYCFIEWPELIESLLEEENIVAVSIANTGENSRKFIFEK